MRLTLLTFGLGPGGAERVLSNLANHWAENGEDVTLITINSARPFYPISDRIKLRQIAAETTNDSPGSRLTCAVARIQKLRRAVCESAPEVAISFQTATNLTALLACNGLGIPVIVSERVDPASAIHSPAVRLLRNLLYARATTIVNQCDRFIDALPRRLHSVCVTIPNAIPPARAMPASREFKFPIPFVASMGRLTYQKGFDLLLAAFAKLHAKYPHWSLVILGEGPDRADLERLKSQSGLDKVVFLPGLVENPQNILQESSLFVLPSRFEGFPNALGEAMACGLPVIAADCRCGPRELVRHEIDGLLVAPEDSPALASALDRLMGDAVARHSFASRAIEVVDRFSVRSIMSFWDDVIDKATNRRPPKLETSQAA